MLATKAVICSFAVKVIWSLLPFLERSGNALKVRLRNMLCPCHVVLLDLCTERLRLNACPHPD